MNGTLDMQGTAQQGTAQQGTAQQDTAQQDTAQQDTASFESLIDLLVSTKFPVHLVVCCKDVQTALDKVIKRLEAWSLQEEENYKIVQTSDWKNECVNIIVDKVFSTSYLYCRIENHLKFAPRNLTIKAIYVTAKSQDQIDLLKSSFRGNLKVAFVDVD